MNSLIIFMILGIIQGFTEPLPISSSGHLLIFQQIFNFNIPGVSFEAFVNFGSTIAIIIFFRKKLEKLISGVLIYLIATLKKFNKKEKTQKEQIKLNKLIKQNIDWWDYFIKIIISSIPLGVAGLTLVLLKYDEVEDIKYVGIALLVTALSLFIVSKLDGEKQIKNISYVDALIIGIFQAIALFPGISRSGMTLVGALLVGIKNKDAFDYSFIMFIPASVLALLYSLISILNSPDINQYILGYILAFILSAIFTWISLIILKKVVIASKLYYFAIYCFIVGTVVLLVF